MWPGYDNELSPQYALPKRYRHKEEIYAEPIDAYSDESFKSFGKYLHYRIDQL